MCALPLFLPCAAGVEALLEEEVLRILPTAKVHAGRGGVALDGDPLDVMTLNLECRLAQRVLAEVAEGPYRDEHDLYELARGVDWQQWITPEHTLRVDTTAHRSPLRSLNFAALRIKDAVCDQLREATGTRPSVDTRHPDLPLLLHVGEERASLYVDTSGEPLFKRGWREDKGDAPLKETLAAAMLAAAGWRGTPEAGGALHDPCCGSGTIAIEAAQIACGIAPGLKRRFAFERLLPFADAEMRAQWQRVKSHAQSRIHASAVPIHASDVSFRMVDFARRNAQRAGVEDAIQFNGGDALERPAPALPAGLPGTLMINPPYGERIEVAGKARASAPSRDEPDGDNKALAADFFPRLSAHWKRAYTQHDGGWTAYVLSPDMKLPGAMRLKESKRVPMWNGPIECRLFRFDLVAGSAR
ncbi:MULTISPECIES: class I SAM-dependent RNA methyltransferase [unclassified Rhizobacter]|uniref:THUMP domain-containing class I SAM-dependent RNA methyltransferase n=1 Tax=unclassified Rhizobacter TaxID=2640088 RepID=UPI0006FE8DE1|nr:MULTISPECIES: THUMP domain-containing protein [unclassified Rhizobacter]KQU76814.1 RNA methyltransferase [Rhizobacter sp. Root29]KQV97334.1 RNA methyltransferase [Rhizobacter sp. Root1238]KRB10006.1 RNA methyltransferase [Rhizobacter sp. Root16D2]